MKGNSNKEIASQLHLAESTIKNRLSVIFEKLYIGHGDGDGGMLVKLRENFEYLTRSDLPGTMIQFTIWCVRQKARKLQVVLEPEEWRIVVAMIESGFSREEIININPHLVGCLLSAREKDLMSYVFVGLSNKEIAYELHLAESTVKNQLSILFGNWGVTERNQLPFRFLTEKIESMEMDPMQVLSLEVIHTNPIVKDLDRLEQLFTVMWGAPDRMSRMDAETGLAIISSIKQALSPVASISYGNRLQLVKELVTRIEDRVNKDGSLRSFCQSNHVMDLFQLSA
jgi:DNA-binding CsgD family transcriptional regulator